VNPGNVITTTKQGAYRYQGNYFFITGFHAYNLK